MVAVPPLRLVGAGLSYWWDTPSMNFDLLTGSYRTEPRALTESTIWKRAKGPKRPYWTSPLPRFSRHLELGHFRNPAVIFHAI